MNKIALYDKHKFDELMENSGIIRNRLKIQSVITNAQACLKIKDECGSFSNYIWNFVGNESIVNKWENISQIPKTTEVSDAMSKDLKKRGFKFVGSTICYAFMQAVGIVNDHTLDCFCYNHVKKLRKVNNNNTESIAVAEVKTDTSKLKLKEKSTVRKIVKRKYSKFVVEIIDQNPKVAVKIDECNNKRGSKRKR
jgi:hypothetical protein